MKEYDLTEFLKGDVAINCNTEKQAKKFLKYLHIQGFEWYLGIRSMRDTNWVKHKGNTCYRLKETENYIDSCNVEFYKNQIGLKIINIEDIEIKKSKKDFIRTLHFKNPCLTQQEYELIKDILSEYISDKDFDKTTWQGNNEYYFISKDIKIPIQIDTLQKLCQNFPSVSLTDKNIYIKNLGGKI